MTKSLYTTQVTVTGGRDGRAQSDDGRLDVTLALPEALGGNGKGTNPEQLFAAGFAGCFTSSLKAVAHQQKKPVDGIAVQGAVTVTLNDAGQYGLRVRLTVTLPGLSADEGAALIAGAERICAYTNATRGNVGLEIVAA